MIFDVAAPNHYNSLAGLVGCGQAR